MNHFLLWCQQYYVRQTADVIFALVEVWTPFSVGLIGCLAHSKDAKVFRLLTESFASYLVKYNASHRVCSVSQYFKDCSQPLRIGAEWASFFRYQCGYRHFLA